MTISKISIKAIEVEQPIGIFYIGVVDYEDLLKIALLDIKNNKKGDPQRTLGFRKQISEKRVDELKQYSLSADAVYPTNLVLAVSSEDVKYDRSRKLLSIEARPNVAVVIDGQHRIASLEGLRKGKFSMLVAFFVDVDADAKANLFYNINLSQNANKSYMYSLFERSKIRTPKKVAATIARLLNTKRDSPLLGRIRTVGLAQTRQKNKKIPSSFVTRFTFVETLDLLISDTESDMDIFKKLYDEQRDAEIALVIWNYFNAVKRKWADEWNDKLSESSLNSKNGFRALMRLLVIVYRKLGRDVPSEDVLWIILNNLRFKGANFKLRPYLELGKIGEDKLFNDLKHALDQIQIRENSHLFNNTSNNYKSY